MSDIIGAGADPNTGNQSGLAMNSLPTNQGAFYLQQLTFWSGIVDNLNALYTKLATSTLDEYNLGSGDGRTMGRRKSLAEVGAEIQFATNRHRFFYQKLYGRGLMSLRERRK